MSDPGRVTSPREGGKRIAILQSSYVPWRGYFDILASVDEFVLFDTVQFTKRDWRNRNKIKTMAGVQWLTIPVVTAGAFHQSIADTRIDDVKWASKHWRSICHAYARAPYFDHYAEQLATTYQACEELRSLSEVNRLWIQRIAALLGLHPVVTDAPVLPEVSDRNDRLIAICHDRGATRYLSGPSAKAYLDVEQFEADGISVEFIDYDGYEPYPQQHGPFEPAVSALDLLLNVGPDSPRYLSFSAGRSRAGAGMMLGQS